MAAFSWLEQLVDQRALLSPRNPHAAETVALLAPLVINFSEFVSKQRAVVLVEAGVRVGYSQLVAGARHSVSNLHVWMRVQRELGIAADVPAYAEKLAYAEGVSADDADGVSHLPSPADLDQTSTSSNLEWQMVSSAAFVRNLGTYSCIPAFGCQLVSLPAGHVMTWS